ncbi:hypothetical protein [Archangium violaceum]|uniref:Uncharacterized protein n=1 Tax=Archangium violaceum Cb vi76 TaxID=1406225 RepID=A0A084SKG2_9BACT|nr:hypothetical protein [Archangium violaceum]KFA88947.1 hypothetical protein Q664_37850 [Archangium violaceum Cb vi76]
MPPSAEDLLALVRNYFRPDKDFNYRPESSPEHERFSEQWERALERMDQWRAFLRELRGELPDFDIGNVTAPCDSCFRCATYPKDKIRPITSSWSVVGCLSILAPVYTVYGARYTYWYTDKGRERSDEVFLYSLPPEMQGPASIIARGIEATFGAEALPREIAETRIPLIVEPQEPPDTTLFHALFISEPEKVP